MYLLFAVQCKGLLRPIVANVRMCCLKINALPHAVVSLW